MGMAARFLSVLITVDEEALPAVGERERFIG